MAKDIAHVTKHDTPSRHTTQQMQNGPWTPHTQHNTPSGHIGEQEPSGPTHSTRNTAHRAGTPVNRSQVAQDTVHATQHSERAHQ